MSPDGPSPSWPPDLDLVFDRSVTAEFATLTRDGRPITTPTTPYVGDREEGGRTLDVSTGLTYPAKAERARRNPKVALLFADPVGPGLEGAPVVLVHGHGAVRDADLQANTDRYVRSSAAKLPDATKGQPKAVLRRMAFYYARIWVEVTPLAIWWWPDRQLDVAPQHWRRTDPSEPPGSDPAPQGAQPRPWLDPQPWQSLVQTALGSLPLADLSVAGPDGFPVIVPVVPGALAGDTIPLAVGPGAPGLTPGPACLTLHNHPAAFTGQENRTLVGRLTGDGGPPRFVIERALADWSLAGNRAQTAISFLSKGRRLAPRLRAEAARRGQPVPKVRFD